MVMENYYDILGVDKKATPDEIKAAYRTMSKKYHPDKNKDPGAEEIFKKANEAYSVLKDENKRKEYDMRLSGQRFGGFGNFGRGFGNGGSWNVHVNNNGGYTEYYYSKGDGGGMFYQPPRDLNTKLRINIRDAYFGCKQQIQIGMKKYNITIKPGTLTGQKLRMKGFGQEGYDSSGNIVKGDLIINIIVSNVGNEKMCLNEDGTLEIMHPIDCFDAILGSDQTIELFDKYINFKSDKFIQNGGSQILKGKGFPVCGKEGEYHDIKVNYIINMPDNLTKEQIELVKKIKGDNNQ